MAPRFFLANERSHSAFYVLGLARVSLEGGALEFKESVVKEKVSNCITTIDNNMLKIRGEKTSYTI